MIKKCRCKSEYQDKKYGQGNRVHNECKVINSTTPHRCTVCGEKK